MTDSSYPELCHLSSLATTGMLQRHLFHYSFRLSIYMKGAGDTMSQVLLGKG